MHVEEQIEEVVDQTQSKGEEDDVLDEEEYKRMIDRRGKKTTT